MLLLLDRYVRGYLLVRLTGYSPERFLNLCKSNHILIWGLVPKEDSYEFYMRKRDFYKARVLLKKSKTRLRIREKHGFPFFYTGIGKEMCIRDRKYLWLKPQDGNITVSLEKKMRKKWGYQKNWP